MIENMKAKYMPHLSIFGPSAMNVSLLFSPCSACASSSSKIRQQQGNICAPCLSVKRVLLKDAGLIAAGIFDNMYRASSRLLARNMIQARNTKVRVSTLLATSLTDCGNGEKSFFLALRVKYS